MVNLFSSHNKRVSFLRLLVCTRHQQYFLQRPEIKDVTVEPRLYSFANIYMKIANEQHKDQFPSRLPGLTPSLHVMRINRSGLQCALLQVFGEQHFLKTLPSLSPHHNWEFSVSPSHLDLGFEDYGLTIDNCVARRWIRVRVQVVHVFVCRLL